MSATKIINILKSDTFDDVFDLFKNTDAQEIIFIFPKGSKFSKQSQYFEAIKKEADSSAKKVSIMTSDPVVTKFALQFHLDLLEQPVRSSRKSQSPAPTSKSEVVERGIDAEAFQTGINQDLLEPALPADRREMETAAPQEAIDEEITNDQEDVMFAAARAIREPTINYSRPIRDIFTVEPDRQIKIKEERSRPIDIDIKNRLEDGRNGKLDDIAKVWAETENKKNRKPLFTANTALKSRFFRKPPILIMGGIILVALVVLYGTLGNAKIIIRPQKQDLNFTLKVSASITTTSVDTDLNKIPGQRFSDKEEVSDTFLATGQKNVVQKASGKITIFNKSFFSQRLVATTRFKTSNGFIFRIPQTVNVPAASKTNSTLKEGSVESLVYADKPGEEYNIGPATFTIPGFEGTPRANDFYAKSDKPMIGGIIGPSKIITEEDFAKAQEGLTAKLKDKILKSIKSQSGELKILDSIPIKFNAPITNAKVGDGAENLQMTVGGTADIIAFRESDVLNLIKNYVNKNGDSELLQKDLTITYINPQFSAGNSMFLFDIQIKGRAAARLDTGKILQDIMGMSETTIRGYFGKNKEVESAHIILSPFWVRNIPKDPAKIKITIVQS